MSKVALLNMSYYILNLLGLVLIILEVGLYRITVIPLLIPISIIIAFGILTFFLTASYLRKFEKKKNLLERVFFSIITGGFISCYVFMASNYFFASKTMTTHSFMILEKSDMPGPKYHRNERSPLVIINYFGFKKELVFRYKDTDKVKRSNHILTMASRGFWGYDILRKYEPIFIN